MKVSAGCHVSPLFYWCIIFILRRMIANSYESESVSENKVCVWVCWVEAKQMDKHWLWPHLWRDLCSKHTVFVSDCSIQMWSLSLFLSSLSHPNRVPLPGHEGGGTWGSGVNQGSWIYRWQSSLPPWAPVSSMRVRPLGGMGLMLSFCVYVLARMYGSVFVWWSSHHNRQKQSPCPVAALSSTAGVGWTRVLHVDVWCHSEDVWKSNMQSLSWLCGIILVVMALQKHPTDPWTDC